MQQSRLQLKGFLDYQEIDMSKHKLVYPMYMLPVEFRPSEGAWHFFNGEPFYNPLNVPTPQTIDDLLHQFGLKKARVLVELFRAGEGRAGHYLVNLRNHKYYYCGLEEETIQRKLHELGIGRPDPCHD
jgi:hypothetical protein